MQVVIKISTDLGRTLRRRVPPTTEPLEPVGIVEALGVALKPMHPGTHEPDLMSYFTVDVADFESAQRVIDRLRQSKAVEAAYLTPPDELP